MKVGKSGFSVEILSKNNGIDSHRTRDTCFEEISVAIRSTLLKEDALGFNVPAWLRLIPKTKESGEKWKRL